MPNGTLTEGRDYILPEDGPIWDNVFASQKAGNATDFFADYFDFEGAMDPASAIVTIGFGQPVDLGPNAITDPNDPRGPVYSGRRAIDGP